MKEKKERSEQAMSSENRTIVPTLCFSLSLSFHLIHQLSAPDSQEVSKHDMDHLLLLLTLPFSTASLQNRFIDPNEYNNKLSQIIVCSHV